MQDTCMRPDALDSAPYFTACGIRGEFMQCHTKGLSHSRWHLATISKRLASSREFGKWIIRRSYHIEWFSAFKRHAVIWLAPDCLTSLKAISMATL